MKKVYEMELSRFQLLTEYHLFELLSFASNKLEVLSMSRIKRTEAMSKRTIELSSSILTLYIYNCECFSIQTFMNLLSKCPLLTALHVIDCTFSHNKPLSTRHASLSLSNLNELTVMNCKKLPTKYISEIISHTVVLDNIHICFALKQIGLVNHELTALDADYIEELVIDAVLEYDWEASPDEAHIRYVKNNFPEVYEANYVTPNLHDKNISSIDVYNEIPDSDTYAQQCTLFAPIAKHCAISLTSLQINIACDKTMPIMLQACGNLQSLDLSVETVDKGDLLITDKLLQAIGMHSKKLTDLNINRCIFPISEGMSLIAQNCSDMKHLALEPCRQRSLHGGMLIFPGVEMSKTMTHLQTLDLGGLHRLQNLDDSLWPVFVSCKQLQYINLNMTSAGDKCIMSIIDNCKLITVLGLRYLSNMTEGVLCQLVTYCTQITHLDLANNECITKNVVKLISTHSIN